MIDKNIIILLHIINTKGNIKRLLRENLKYKDISELIEQAVKNKLVLYKDEKISLTKKGLKFLKTGEELIKKTNKDEWIEKESKSQISKLEKDFIFLPNQNALDF